MNRMEPGENATGDTWTVYSKPNCRQCKALKDYLIMKGQPFIELSVVLASPLIERYPDLKSAPVVVGPDNGDGSAVFCGFRPDFISRELIKE